jgi:asparagine synthase (glutamine-hydrolysing)
LPPSKINFQELTFSCIPGEDTFFKNVFKILPGHYFEYQNGDLLIKKYFDVTFDIKNNKDINYFSEQISRALEESVFAHKISDVEVGCFLSGGVDSSIVAYELSKLNKIKTFTIGFEDKRYSEDISAKSLAKEIGVENEVKLINSDEYFSDIGKVQYHLDEPLANPSANLLFFLSKLASNKVKVVQSGEGADEMFGGYNVYKEPLSIARYSIFPLKVRKIIAKYAEYLPEFKGKNFLIRGAKPIEERYLGNSNIFSDDEKSKILKRKSNPSSPFT